MKKNKKSLQDQKNDLLLAVSFAVLTGTAAYLAGRIEKLQRDMAIRKAAAAVKQEDTDGLQH